MEGRGEKLPRPRPLSTAGDQQTLPCRGIGNVKYRVCVRVNVCTCNIPSQGLKTLYVPDFGSDEKRISCHIHGRPHGIEMGE